MTPFRRDGHLSDLGIDHTLAGSALPGTHAHLGQCGACAARVHAAETSDLPLLPSSLVGPVSTPTPANRPWMWAGLLAAAAVAAFATVPLLSSNPEEFPDIRVKGSGISLQVFRDEGEVSPRLRNGDPISPGDRLGFRVRHPKGHLMIIGIDARDDPYLCYPQSGGGESAEVRASTRPQPLPEAIRMDDAPGRERIVAVLCDHPFDFDPLADALLDGHLPEGCASSELELEKL